MMNGFTKRVKNYLVILVTILSCLVQSKIAYPAGCSNKPTNYYDYDSCPLPPPQDQIRSRCDFQLLKRLGAGKFSDVFEAVDMTYLSSKGGEIPDEALVAIKVR